MRRCDNYLGRHWNLDLRSAGADKDANKQKLSLPYRNIQMDAPHSIIIQRCIGLFIVTCLFSIFYGYQNELSPTDISTFVFL